MKFTGEKLRLLRQARGMKQGELARKMGIKQQRISALENSPEISIEQEIKIFEVLNFFKEQAEEILKMLTPGNKQWAIKQALIKNNVD